MRDLGKTTNAIAYNPDNSGNELILLEATNGNFRTYDAATLAFVNARVVSPAASNARGIASNNVNMFIGTVNRGWWKYNMVGGSGVQYNTSGEDCSHMYYSKAMDRLFSLSGVTDGEATLREWNYTTGAEISSTILALGLITIVDAFMIDDAYEFMYIQPSGASLYKFDLTLNEPVAYVLTLDGASSDGWASTPDLTKMWHWDSADYLHERLTTPCKGNLASGNNSTVAGADYTRIK